MNEYIPEFSMLVLQVLPHERKLVRTNKMENFFVLIEDEILLQYYHFLVFYLDFTFSTPPKKGSMR